MCKKTNYKIPNPRIDKCMRNLIQHINTMLPKYQKIVSCCCGHGKYPMTILIKYSNGIIVDIVSGVQIERKRKFYKRDKQGYYYIPEVIKKED